MTRSLTYSVRYRDWCKTNYIMRFFWCILTKPPIFTYKHWCRYTLHHEFIWCTLTKPPIVTYIHWCRNTLHLEFIWCTLTKPLIQSDTKTGVETHYIMSFIGASSPNLLLSVQTLIWVLHTRVKWKLYPGTFSFVSDVGNSADYKVNDLCEPSPVYRIRLIWPCSS